MSKDSTIKQLIEATKKAFDEGRIVTRDKCCSKCAFRENSGERCDEYGWLSCAEEWTEGQIFVCHEGLPSHPQQVEGEPLQVCAGWAAMQGKPLEDWVKLAYTDGGEPDPKYQEGYQYMPEEDEFDKVENEWCKPCKKYNKCVIFHEAFSCMKGLEPSQWLYDADGKPHCTEREV